MMKFTALRIPMLTEEVAVELKVLFSNLPGIEQFTLALEKHELHILFDESRLDFQTLAREMARVGCPLRNIEAALLRQVSLPEEKKCIKKF